MSTTPPCVPVPALTPPHVRATLAVATALLFIHVVTIARLPRHAAPLQNTGLDLRLRLDPNTATADELALLPGIGPRLAENIITYRTAVAPPAFHASADLERVPRIGPAIAAQLHPYLRFPPAPATSAEESAPAADTNPSP